MWYYMSGEQRMGPIDAAEIERLITTGQIVSDTYLWREGMSDWQPAAQTEFSAKLTSQPASAVPSGSSTTSPFPPSAQPSPSEDVRNLDQWFTIFWICLAVGLPTSIIVIGLAGLIVAVVFSCMILHKLWSLIPPGDAKTTPGKAVGFLFIPLFNFYWNFIAIHGLAQALNRETRRQGISGHQIDERASLGFCIAACAAALLFELPMLSALFGLAQIALLIFTLMQMKNAGKALLLNR